MIIRIHNINKTNSSDIYEYEDWNDRPESMAKHSNSNPNPSLMQRGNINDSNNIINI